jgi:ribosomal protein L11 methyltransferase
MENELNILLNKYDINYSKSIIKKQNWNALWESNFEPVQVDDFVGIRAAFHPPFTSVLHEIIITPKMSFGTGHHATTYMVMKLMQELDFKNKSVFDFGTGTGYPGHSC